MKAIVDGLGWYAVAAVLCAGTIWLGNQLTRRKQYRGGHKTGRHAKRRGRR